MNAKGVFITTILTVDSFLICFALGFNSRHVLEVDPALPPLPASPAKASEVSRAKPSNTQTAGKPTAPAKQAGEQPAQGAKSHKPGHEVHAAGNKHAHTSPTSKSTHNKPAD